MIYAKLLLKAVQSNLEAYRESVPSFKENLP